MEYTPTIGLEVHAELKTATKMFCSSRNDPDEARPNVNVCPVCMAFPGTLPVPNKEAIRQVLRMGTAVGGTIADYTEFDRKNYFYPDIPKGFQISQYQFPLVSGGTLAGIAITRIHLEEDTARSQHGGDGFSLIDFNRAGMPLMELVTEPVIHDATTAGNFARELQLLLRYIGAGDANMEKGQMRVEANISVSKDKTLGTKVEVKNLNSFRSVERAIAFEVDRQIKALEAGEPLVQETRGWDEVKGVTFSQRKKENSNDYRYFPEPDIPKFSISRIAEFSNDSLRGSLPELPWQKRERYIALGLKEVDVAVLVEDTNYGLFFETEIVGKIEKGSKLTTATNYLLSDVRGQGGGKAELDNLSNGVFSELVDLIDAGEISSRGGKDLLGFLMKEKGSPRTLAEKHGLLQVHDVDLLGKVADEVIQENATVVNEVRAGKEEALKFLVGQGMKKSKGSANPTELSRILKERIG